MQYEDQVLSRDDPHFSCVKLIEQTHHRKDDSPLYVQENMS